MGNCGQPAPQPSADQAPLLITPNASLDNWLQCCPHAQTLSFWGPDGETECLIPLACNQWSCRWCATRKIRALARRTRDAKPNRLLTLTVDPARYDSPRAAFDQTRRLVSVLVSKLRKRFGELEYLRVTEVTRRGFPHYHLLVRSPYLPHPVVKAEWQRLTGATIVDVRQVPPTWSAVTYLTKYLSKLHDLEWTNRHVSYSRRFFPPAVPVDDDDPLGALGVTVIHSHPRSYLLEHHSGATVRWGEKHVIVIQPAPSRQEITQWPHSSLPAEATASADATPNATTPTQTPPATASAVEPATGSAPTTPPESSST
jgi:hypothetical protein